MSNDFNPDDFIVVVKDLVKVGNLTLMLCNS